MAEATLTRTHAGGQWQSEQPVAIFVQEHIPRGNLSDFIQVYGPFEEWVCKYYFHQLLGALQYIHSQDMVHRDLKPLNLLLDAQFNLKITEFGFSCRTKSMLQSTYTPGTRGFMAPEIWKGSYNAQEADLFACGIILFFMRTGK